VETASQILHKLRDVMQLKHKRIQDKWIEGRDLLSQKFIETVTRVTSNLIAAASILAQRYAIKCRDSHNLRWILLNVQAISAKNIY